MSQLLILLILSLTLLNDMPWYPNLHMLFRSISNRDWYDDSAMRAEWQCKTRRIYNNWTMVGTREITKRMFGVLFIPFPHGNYHSPGGSHINSRFKRFTKSESATNLCLIFIMPFNFIVVNCGSRADSNQVSFSFFRLQNFYMETVYQLLTNNI